MGDGHGFETAGLRPAGQVFASSSWDLGFRQQGAAKLTVPPFLPGFTIPCSKNIFAFYRLLLFEAVKRQPCAKIKR